MLPNWNERYASNEFLYGKEPNDFLKEKASLIRPGGEVLSLAEGEGRNAVFLASLGLQVTAVDGSSVGIEKLSALAKERGVRVKGIVSDLADFEMGENRWEAIVMIWCHLPAALRKEVLRRSERALRTGGLILIESYTPKQLEYGTGGPPVAEMMPTLEQLRQELELLEEVHGVERDRIVKEGRGHFGKSAVVQYIARKRDESI